MVFVEQQIDAPGDGVGIDGTVENKGPVLRVRNRRLAQQGQTCEKGCREQYEPALATFRGRRRIPTTIVIADDHALTVDGTRSVIESMHGFEVAAIASNGIEAISLIKRLSPDCALLDLIMPGASGLEVLIEAHRWSPRTKIAIVTGSPSAQALRQLIDAGAAGIFLKTGPVEELAAGLRDIVAGRSIVSPDVSRYIEEHQARDNLSNREIEVLKCIARGLSNNGIAERLGISPKTVDNHRTNLMRKLEVHSTATLLVRAIRDGLIDI